MPSATSTAKQSERPRIPRIQFGAGGEGLGALACLRHSARVHYLALRRSPWLPVAGRAAGGLLCLLVLAGIGAWSLTSGHSGFHLQATAESSEPEWLADAPRKQATPGNYTLASSTERKGTEARPRVEPRNEAADAATHPTKDGGPPSGIAADGRVILNLASAAELTRLPGVGPKRADAIVALRGRLKRFRRPSDLLRVRGIGPKTLRKMLPHLTVDPPPAEESSPPKETRT